MKVINLSTVTILLALCVGDVFAGDTQQSVRQSETPKFAAISSGSGSLEDFQSRMTTFSELHPVKEFSSFSFWGLEQTSPERLQDFLHDRAMICSLVFMVDDLGYIDCVVSPERGGEALSYGSHENWLDLFTWLPELGLAERRCDDEMLRRRITFLDDRTSYFCDQDRNPFRSISS